jgi:diguanylate cyclase (GGDEF)-like protein
MATGRTVTWGELRRPTREEIEAKNRIGAIFMQGIEQEAPAEVTASGTAGQADRDTAPPGDLGRLRWGLRVGGTIFAIISAALLSAAYAADVGWKFHVMNGLIFVAVLLMAYALAAISRRTHLEQEQRYPAQPVIDSLELQDTAMRDYLTQLFNRRYFFQRLGREMDRARRLQSPLAILVLDVNHLDAINDAYGHKVGDVALAKLSRLILKCTRTSDIPARLGGDEFGVIMPETDRRGAFVVATRIRRTLEVTPVYEHGGHSLKLTVSLGVSGFPWDGESGDELVRKADACMYVVKAARHGDTDIPSGTPSEPTLTG